MASLTGLGLDSGACSLLTVLHGTSCFMSLTLSFPIGGLGSFCVYFHGHECVSDMLFSENVCLGKYSLYDFNCI